MPWAASYSASKAGLAGFTEALRFELASRSGIDVCGVYTAYVDTLTYLNSANYTGRALRPLPPVVSPERVAERIVGLALGPRRSVRVGSLHASSVPYAPTTNALAPVLTIVLSLIAYQTLPTPTPRLASCSPLSARPLRSSATRGGERPSKKGQARTETRSGARSPGRRCSKQRLSPSRENPEWSGRSGPGPSQPLRFG